MYAQLTFADLATAEIDAIRATQAMERTDTPLTPAERTQTQETAKTCVLCGGHMTGNVCEKCGVEVCL